MTASKYQVNARVPKHIYDIVHALGYTYDLSAAHVAERLWTELFAHPDIVQAAFRDMLPADTREEARTYLHSAGILREENHARSTD